MTEEINAVNDVAPEQTETDTSALNHAADTQPDASSEESQQNLSKIDNATEPESLAGEENQARPSTPPPILTTSGKKRPPYTYDPNKVTLRFIFANRDGLAVTIECKPADTVGDVKGALLSVWPKGT
jgi:hypothetical protein